MRSDGAQDWILWLGAPVDEATIARFPSNNPGSSSWQSQIIRALAKRNLRVLCAGCVPDRMWPLGKTFRMKGSDGHLAPGLEGTLISYWNLPTVREKHRAMMLKSAARSFIAKHGRPIAVITNNPYPSSVPVALYLQSREKIPWISIVADPPRKRREDIWSYEQSTKAAAQIFLSYYDFDTCKSTAKLHLDGGVHLRPIATEEIGKTFLYAGGLAEEKGVFGMVRGFKATPDPDIELWMCGQNPGQDLIDLCKEDPRIRILGRVSEQELERLGQSARAFINPYTVGLEMNSHNFPSKLLFYLGFQKPVISTWTPGLAPHYREVLEVLEQDSTECLSAAISKVASYSKEELEATAETITKFAAEKKNWDYHAEQVERLIQSVSTDGRSPS